MAAISAGLLMYRQRPSGLEVLLAHPGGPFWQNKDAGAWTIPKGEANAGEDLLVAARREFEEETGATAHGEFIPLDPIKQKAGKIVYAWCVESDLDTRTIRSNTFEIEWPLKSGRRQQFPEVDRAEFFDLPTARIKILASQAPLLRQLEELRSGYPR